MCSSDLPTLSELPQITTVDNWSGINATLPVLVDDGQGGMIDVGHKVWLQGPGGLPAAVHPLTVTGQFAAGQGNQKGTAVDASGESLDFIGGAGFVELKAPGWRSSVIGRYDYFDRDGEPATGRVIAGYAFHFLKQNFVLVSVDHLSYLDQHRPAD